jgi:hypothetical protein
MAPIKISEEDKKAANLRVLQKEDADIIEIVALASHAVLYGFNVSSTSWEKRNVEGKHILLPTYVFIFVISLMPLLISIKGLYLLQNDQSFPASRSSL